jgi:hypothetical protein
MKAALVILGFSFLSICFFLVHVTIFRMGKVTHAMFALVKIILVLSVIYLALLAITMDKMLLSYDDAAVISMGTLGLFWCMSLTYSILGPVMADRSVSAFLLILLARKKEGTLTKNEIFQKLNPQLVFEKRLMEHADVGAVVVVGEDVSIAPKGRRIALVFEVMLKALRLKENF